MQKRVVLEELNADLATARAKIDGWSKAKLSTAEDLREKQKKIVERDRAQLASLKADHEDILRQAERVKERVQIEEIEEREARSEVEEWEHEAQRAQQELRAWQEKLSTEQIDVQEREKGIAFELDEARTKLTALDSEIQKFQGSLGLSFVKSEGVEGELLLIFTHVNPQAHDEEYTIGVRISADNKYEVTVCSPEVASIDVLLSELNRTGQFCDFVKQVRACFKQGL